MKQGNQKKYLLLSSFAIMLVLFCQSALSADTATLKTTLLRYDPTPAQIGDYMTAYIQIENIGNSPAEKVKIQFIDNYPFSMDNAGDKMVDAGTIGIGQTYITNFKIRIDEKALSGINELKFSVSNPQIGNLDLVFDVNIRSLITDLSIQKVSVTPAGLNPGDLAKISITLKNVEDSTLTQISTNLLVFTTFGGVAADLPFAIQDSVSKKIIPVLKSGEEADIVYNIQSYPSIKPGIYKVPLTIGFFDGTGLNYTKTEFISIVINPKVDAYLTIDRSDLTATNKIGNVDFKVVNKGFGQIQFANLKIGQSPDFDLLNPYNQIYIGSIDSDDYKTGEFQINANKNVIIIPATVTFKDSLNIDHEINQNLTLTLLTAAETGQKSSSNIWIIIVVLLIAVVGFWFYRRKKKK